MKIREIECKAAIGKCGFPGGGWAINPYVGCGHDCQYCYARFIKRFTGHSEEWGSFVDVRTNIADVLGKQLKSGKYDDQQIYLSTVTDPYQPLEKDYQLTGKIVEALLERRGIKLSILTKSDLVLRDINLLKQFGKRIDINFTINSLDKKWADLIEPNSSEPKARLAAAKELSREGINVFAMVGPYWPVFTDIEKLFFEFEKAGIKKIFSESFNTIGGNWIGVEKALRESYPGLLHHFQEIFFSKEKFFDFYSAAQKKIDALSKKFSIPVQTYFGLGHAGKFKKTAD